ncbi:hypothetical protein MMC22_003232 [Lobaria immixta]|nr:hypothetical protein [Lobaria immixta]
MAESSNQVVATLTAPDHEPDVDKASSRNQAVAKVTSKPSLLDLPPEIRLMIYRHLLVRSDALPQYWWYWPHEPPPDGNILKTCRLIYKEASHVLYTENAFRDFFWCSYPGGGGLGSPRIREILQNLHFELQVIQQKRDYKAVEMCTFKKFGKLYGYPSAIRGRLTVILKPYKPYKQELPWLARALSRFVNFKTIELYLDNKFLDCVHVLEWLQTALEPMLGRAEVVEKFGYRGKGLQFHPVDQRDLSKGPDDADWVEFLNGIHLGV